MVSCFIVLSPFLPPTLLAVFLAIVVLLVLYAVPKLQVKETRLNREDKGPLELENDYRQTLVQIVGGIAIVVTVYAAIDNARLAREAIAQTARSYELARQGQVADRTFKAMDMLSKKDNIDARLTAIYALSQIANEDPKSEWQITETLFNYVQVHSTWQPSRPKKTSEALPPDIAAVGDFLARRPYKTGNDGECIEEHQCWDYNNKNKPTERDIPNYYRKIINLPGVDLHHVFLAGAMLKTANIPGSHMERAWLRHAHCENTYAELVHLEGADLSDSYWSFANLKGAHLKDAQLCRAHFEHVYAEGSNLADADLEDTHWENVSQFGKSSLRNANLECSNWHGAEMQDLILEGADLIGADLRGANHLTKLQLEKARGDNSTKLSDETLRPSSWSQNKQIDCSKRPLRPPCPPT